MTPNLRLLATVATGCIAVTLAGCSQPSTDLVDYEPSPSPAVEPSPDLPPDVAGQSLPDAEDELDEAGFSVGELILLTADDEGPWTKAAIQVCAQHSDDDDVDLSVVQDTVQCPEDPDGASESWPVLPEFTGDTVDEARAWAEGAGIGVTSKSAFGDVDDPKLDEAGDHRVCEHTPGEGEREAPYPDTLKVRLYVVAPGEECPEEVGDPYPQPDEPEPEPEPAPETQPQEQTEEGSTGGDPGSSTHHQGVHPGAFCSEHWQYGNTSAGTLMQCTTTPEDERFRWRAA